MNKSLLIGLVIGAGAAAGMGALASLAFKNNQEAPREILAADQAAADYPLLEGTGEEMAPSSDEAPDAADAAAPVAATPALPAARAEKAVRKEPSYARVVSVEPATRSVSEPREVCREVEVVKQAPVRDEKQVAGTVIGGVIGGVIGNQIGDGDGKKIARIAGALGGAYAGNKVQERIQNNRTVTAMETKCETVYDSREVPDGYRVTYEWKGSTRTVNMPSDPGSRLPVRKGEVILTANAD
jgi:uncharacterized protein YcfJ